MPIQIDEMPRPDPVLDRLAPGELPTSTPMGTQAAFLGSTMTGQALGFLNAKAQDAGSFLSNTYRSVQRGLGGVPDPFGATDTLPLNADVANARYGVDDYLHFDKPISEPDAAFQSAEAHRRAFQDGVLANTSAGPLQRIGASLAGGIMDPVGLPLWFVPELTVGRALKSAFVADRLAFLGNAGRAALTQGIEGAATGGLYESLNYGLTRAEGQDYDYGAGLANIALMATLGAAGGALHGAFGDHVEAAPERRASPGEPAPVSNLTDNARLGAFAAAVDATSDNAPVRLGDLVEAEAARPKGLEHLDETPEALQDRGALPVRALDADVAVTTRGTEIPVQYALAELDHLTTSHDDNLSRNPAYPQELQPRERDRAGAQARNYALEQDLNPRRLMFDSGAETGAPIVSRDGVVESGNGRTIALRRSARADGPAWQRYKAELERQGLDTTGFDNPVLVRQRTEPMTGDARAALTREMNADVTERLSAPEQAMADARGIDDASLELLDGTPAGDRAFARSFLGKVATDQQNAFADAGGNLSAEGARRIRAALVARAYQDPSLVSALFEAADPNIRTIGQALGDAAAGWARMRAAAARGEIPAELDLTANLRSAIDLIRHARDNRIPLAELVADRLDQVEMFGGQSISPETEAFLRLMFRDEGLKRHRSADKIAWALNDYARQAGEVKPGPNLFGETPDGDAKLILDGLTQRFQRDEAFPTEADLADLADIPQSPEPARLDLLTPAGGGGGPDVQPGGVGQADSHSQGGDGGHQRPGSPGPETPPAGNAALTETEAFKNWFGESKIVDAGGAPLVMFHGTADAFDDFRIDGRGGSQAAAYFTPVPRKAGNYASIAGRAKGDGANVRPVYLAVRNPKIIGEGELGHDMPHQKLDKSSFVLDLKQVAELKAQGYDGVINYTAREVAVFDPEQIKSIFETPERLGAADGARGPSKALQRALEADPELKAGLEDTEAAAAGLGLKPPEGPDDPATLAEAIRAAALCLRLEE